jgi:hypothetical protein
MDMNELIDNQSEGLEDWRNACIDCKRDIEKSLRDGKIYIPACQSEYFRCSNGYNMPCIDMI